MSWWECTFKGKLWINGITDGRNVELTLGNDMKIKDAFTAKLFWHGEGILDLVMVPKVKSEWYTHEEEVFLKVKGKVYAVYMWSIMAYGSESWIIDTENRLKKSRNECLDLGLL